MTDLLLLAILTTLLLSMSQRGYYARKRESALKAHTDAMDDLSRTLNMCIDEVRSVQTYGLRIQK